MRHHNSFTRVASSYKVESAPLANESLETIARRFNDLLESTRSRFGWANEAAAKVLMDKVKDLPNNEKALLLNRAVQINSDRIDGEGWGLPMLTVVFTDLDGDGVPMELQDVRLRIPAWQQGTITKPGKYAGAYVRDFYNLPEK